MCFIRLEVDCIELDFYLFFIGLLSAFIATFIVILQLKWVAVQCLVRTWS